MPTSHSALSPNLSRNRTVTKPSVRTKGGIVVAQNRCAAEIGARVLSEGGHAVDAAVATAFALGVVEPWMSGIGGVGAMLIHDAKSGAVGGIDFGGCAPEALDPADFPLLGGKDSDLFGWPAVKDNRNTIGAKAVVAPTEPAGLAFAHKKHGRKPWRDLLAPAVKLAEDGPIVDWHTTLVIASAMADLSKNPAARARFLPTGFPPDAPHASSTTQLRLPMKDLAKTLATLAADGADALYKGALAKSIAADVKAMGGYLSERDLASVTPREVTPREIAHGRSTIHVLPELNGGPTLAVAYAELARLRKATEANPGAETFTHYAEAMRAGWKHRFEKMGDAGELTAPTSTTHLCVVDRDGNMVTLTQTLLSLFGARIVLPGTGILMNNGINWFDPRPGGPNAIAPSRRVLANYAPAIMTGGNAVTAIGGCGGRRILPAVFQLLALSADFGFDLDQAFHHPRIDVSGLGPVVLDRRLSEPTKQALAIRFDTVMAEPVEFPFPFTIAGAVRRVQEMNEGATEPYHPWSEAVAEESIA